MLVNVKLSGEIVDSDCKLDLNRQEVIHKLGSSIEQEVKVIIESGWAAVARMHADLPGYADQIHRKYPDTWQTMKQHWPDQLPKLDIDLQVRVSIDRIGLAQKS